METENKRSYWRIRPGEGAKYADLFYEGNFIAIGWNVGDLSQAINEMKADKDSDKFWEKIVSASREAWGEDEVINNFGADQVYTFSLDISQGDLVFMPVAKGAPSFRIAEVTGAYYYDDNNGTDHYFNCHKVRWLKEIGRDTIEAKSPEFWRLLNTPKTLISLDDYASVIESLLGNMTQTEFQGDNSNVSASGEPHEDIISFALEKHLEDFLIENWEKTEIGQRYDLYKEGENIVGQQYWTEAGIIDILAKSKDGKELLVIELKRNWTSDVVVGQILRYIGFVQKRLAKERQKVRGCIIALEADNRLQYALAPLNDLVDFYRYKIDFKLVAQKDKEEQE